MLAQMPVQVVGEVLPVGLADGGKKLNVRGDIGIPMLGRSWMRQE